MDTLLKAQELVTLVHKVFRPRVEDRDLAVLVDLPDSGAHDTPEWRERRQIAAGWVRELRVGRVALGMDAHLVLYRNVRMNNAELPNTAWLWTGESLPVSADLVAPETAVPFDRILKANSILVAVTEFSATAPLKVMARSYGFRAATMPGFAPSMIPALRLDYEQVHQRVMVFKTLLDRAERSEIRFRVEGGAGHFLTLDLRHRKAHASSGLLPNPGEAGNLPSGEAYIVPYEGEIPGDRSATSGQLPVQFGSEVVVYSISENHAREVIGSGDAARREADHLRRQPAYGNIAELGLGVLADFGILPCGSTLLDEKLGLHIAFGRSDHFGGQVGPAQFSRPEEVVHIDRIYLPSVQPRVHVDRADLRMPCGETFELIRDDRYVVDFGISGDPQIRAT